MKNSIRQGGLVLLLPWLALTLDAAALAQGEIHRSDDRFDNADQCRFINDNMQRLLCFDKLFETPVAIVPSQIEEEQQDTSVSAQEQADQEKPIGDMILAMEQARPNGFDDWQTHIRRWQNGDLVWSGAMNDTNLSDQELMRNNRERNPVDIFMTMREANIADDRPLSERAILLLSCDNDITTLGVLLPQPINTLSANLSLSGPSGSTHRLNWRNVESGSLVIAGRGLESIETIKAIADYPRIQFQVSYPEGSRAFVFNMGGLKARLRALRIACHW